MKSCKIISIMLCIAAVLCVFTACDEADNISDNSLLMQEQSSIPEEKLDTASKYLPDIFAFLYHSPSTDKRYGDDGWQSKCNGSHPGAAFKTVQEELLSLMSDKRYQLKLTGSQINPHYIGIEMYDYFYTYTGTADDIKTLVDEYEENEFNVRLRITYVPEDNYFQFGIVYSRGFVLEDPIKRTTRDISKNSDGGILTNPPKQEADSSSGTTDGYDIFVPNFSKLDCLTCKGDGDCSTCGGDGYTGFGDAKAGCRTCHGNGKCRACNGTGKR